MPFITEPQTEEPGLEPIAICGMGCRLPGKVDSPSSLWELLIKKGSGSMAKVPKSRFNIDAHYHSNLERPGSFNVLGGYFLDGLAEDFDPTFFNMTPIEAMWLDPQQRKILEVCYEAIESAGLTLDSLAGSNTAVYVGSFTADYQQMTFKDPDFRHSYAATGVDPGIISNRIGNIFDLKGPSFTINTACSSSVYAIHNACHALRARDCEAALVGGVNLVLTVDQHMNTAKLGVLSPTSFCHTFDEVADGYGRGEGAGALYLKRMSDAVRDGDVIRAVIRSSATNTNGKVPGYGITYPNRSGQEMVIRAAYKRANLDPNQTAYFECHGTGTPVGDPIEARAVAAAMNDTRSPAKPLLLGAVKPNIGHSEAASGIFAVMKAALMTETGVIPGVAGLNKVNPLIPEAELNIKVNKDTSAWPQGFNFRRASVSSFGYGGTNAHVIVESVHTLLPEYQHGAHRHDAPYDHSTTRPLLITMSAHDKTTLTRNIEAHRAVVDRYYLADFAYTLNHKRTRFNSRGYTVATEGSQAEDMSLSSFKLGSRRTTAPQIAFVFTGQGAQWAGVGRHAIDAFPTFMATIQDLDAVLRNLEHPPDFSLEEELSAPAESSRIDHVNIAQPTLVGIQIALVDLLNSWGITPTATVGHSAGEYAAAYAAGLASAPEIITAAYYRGYSLKHNAPTGGTMLAVGKGPSEVAEYVPNLGQDIVIACENSPSSVTLSGTSVAIHEAKEVFESKQIFARELKTGMAYHSPQMATVATPMVGLVSQAWQQMNPGLLSWRCPRTTMVSSVTNQPIADGELTPTYWATNLTGKVRFSDAVATLITMPGHESIGCYVEIGPHSALSGPFKQICLANQFSGLTYVPTLVRNKNSATQLLKTAGELFIEDFPIDLAAVNEIERPERAFGIEKSPLQPHTLVDLPKYAWNYEKTYWAEPRFSAEYRQPSHARHDLLGSRIPGLSDRSMVWRNILRLKDVPWLQEHKLGGSIMFPAAGHMALAIEATRQYCEIKDINIHGLTVRDLELTTALVIPDGDNGLEVQLRLSKDAASSDATPKFAFFVESYSNDSWNLHSQGTISPVTLENQSATPASHPVNVAALTERHTGKRWNDTFKRVGFEYNGSFNALDKIRNHEKHYEAAGEIPIATASGHVAEESRYILHPSTVDCLLQLCIISIHAGLYQDMPWGVIPVKFEEVSFRFPTSHDVTAPGAAIAWNEHRGARARHFNTNGRLMSADGKQVLLDIRGLRTVSYEAALPPSTGVKLPPMPYAGVHWKPDLSLASAFSQAVSAHQLATPQTSALSSIIELLHHKKPLSKVLVMAAPSSSWLSTVLESVPSTTALNIASNFEAVGAATLEDLQSRANLIDMSESSVSPEGMDDGSQDLIIGDEAFTAKVIESGSLSFLKTLLTSNGTLLLDDASVTRKDDFISAASTCGLLHQLVGDEAPILVCQPIHEPVTTTSESNLTLVYSRAHSPAPEGLARVLGSDYCNVQTKEISEVDVTIDKQIVLYNTSGNLLSQLTPEAFSSINNIVPSGASILWLTSGVNEGKCPQGALAQGFLRVVREEQKMAQVSLLDVDRSESFESMSQAIGAILRSKDKSSTEEAEFWLHNGVCHVGRVEPSKSINERMCPPKETIIEASLPEKQPFEAVIESGELLFQPSNGLSKSALSQNDLEIQVQSLQFDRRDLSAEVEAPRLVTGTVINAGSLVDTQWLGRFVVAVVSNPYQTIIRAPAYLCSEIDPVDAAGLVEVLPNICKALNCLQRANGPTERQHVMLLPSSKAIADAYATLSNAMGFKLTIVQQEDGASLHKYPQGQTTDVLASHDSSAISRVLRGLKTRAPTLVIASDFEDFSQSVWRNVPASASFVVSEGADNLATPDMTPFARGATFCVTSVAAVQRSSNDAMGDLLQSAMQMLRARIIAMPTKSTADNITTIASDPAGVTEKQVLSYFYNEEPVKIKPDTHKLRFDPDHCYLLVGCLGGLGRSLTSWMMDRGAKHFAFVSRSGADKPEAARLIESITEAGAVTKVFRGDASNVGDLRRIVKDLSAERLIRGVVHAAMVLEDAMLGSTMTHDKFRKCLAPKVDGALALHDALARHDLDFFVLTSSISGIIGQPGQSNYAAANAFLDAFALQRRRSGLPATSLALPMVLGVGVVAENEGLEDKISRRGLYGVDEREMLRGFEAAMSQPLPPANGAGARSHADAALIMGLEPSRLAAALGAEKTTDTAWASEPRFSALSPLVTAAGASMSSAGGAGGAAEFLASMAAAYASDGGRNAAVEMVARHVMAKCGSILMLDVDSFEMEGQSIGGYGLDSMIGAELRNWLYSEFGLNIAFQELLATTLTFKGLGDIIVDSLAL